jgi:hypothetical protein
MVRDPQRGVAKRLRLAGKVRDGVAGGIEPPVGEHHTELHGFTSSRPLGRRRGRHGDAGGRRCRGP